jgi:hypothetical protein
MSQILKKSLGIGGKNEIRFEQWNTGHKKLVKRKKGRQGWTGFIQKAKA